MGSSEIWYKYIPRVLHWNGTNCRPISNTTQVVFIPNFHCYPCYSMLIPDMLLMYENLCCYAQIVLQWNLSIMDILGPDIFDHFLLQYMYRGFPLSEVKNVLVTPVETNPYYKGFIYGVLNLEGILREVPLHT